jgi:hypothetical protein
MKNRMNNAVKVLVFMKPAALIWQEFLTKQWRTCCTYCARAANGAVLPHSFPSGPVFMLIGASAVSLTGTV